MYWAVVKFNNAPHRDNEDVEVIAPFDSSDDAFKWAGIDCKFYHVVKLRQPTGGLRTVKIVPITTADIEAGDRGR